MQPQIYDVCVFGGSWSRRGVACGKEAGSRFGANGQPSAQSFYQSAETLLTEGGVANGATIDSNGEGRLVFIYGYHFVASGAIGKVTVEFLSPISEHTKLQCMVDANNAFYQDGNVDCVKGCTIVCNAPEGYGKDWRVRVKRGGLISSETSFLVSYHPPPQWMVL